MQYKYADDLKALAAYAVENGATISSPVSAMWDVAGRCSNPHGISHTGRTGLVNLPGDTYHLDLQVPCRKCESCLRARRRVWQTRARNEYTLSERTWFGTLTLRPEEHFKCVASYDAGGGDFKSLTADEAFAVRHKHVSRWITLYLKRVRKNSGATIRYLFVAEKHQNGLPHYHALVHEVGSNPVTKRQLQAEWVHGFSSWKLISDIGACGYVTKYLGKSKDARVRASIGYGKGHQSVSKLEVRRERVGVDRTTEKFEGEETQRSGKETVGTVR